MFKIECYDGADVKTYWEWIITIRENRRRVFKCGA